MIEKTKILHHEKSIQHVIDLVKPFYDRLHDNHGWEHISSVLRHVDTLREHDANKKDDQIWNTAKTAVVFHDLDRAGVPAKEAAVLLESLHLSGSEMADIATSVLNHNKPKDRWSDPNHKITQILYDADKMDSTRERFAPTKQVDGKTVNTGENDFIGYVLMVRDSMTSPIARSTVTATLPPELHIDPANQSVPVDTIRAYTDKLREIWRDVNMPMKRTVAKLLLTTTSNAEYTRAISAAYPHITSEQINKLSPKRRHWISYISNLKNISEYFLSHIDELASTARDPMIDKGKVVSALKEKLFVYDSVMQSIMTYPKNRERDVGLLLDRMKDEKSMHENYVFFQDQSAAERKAIGPEEFEKRKAYFDTLLRDRLLQIDHYSPYGNIDALKGGRRLLDRAIADLYSGSDSSSILDIIDQAIEKKDPERAGAIIKHFRQDSLRATDRVNDALRTDRFIYSLIRGQTIDAPVRNLPYIYRMDGSTLSDNGLHYYNPTHPQALHAMKMRLPHEQMPQILNDTIHFFTQGMYSPPDYRSVMTDLFATVFKQSDVKPEALDYLLTHVVVNEDADLSRHVSGRFVSDGWLELDFGSRKDPLWNDAKSMLDKINAYSKKTGIIPPIRPYAVCDKEIDTKDDRIEIIPNPEAH